MHRPLVLHHLIPILSYQYPFLSICRNYSDDETVDLPQSERRALLESRSGSRGRAYADEEKSGSGSSFNTMSSGNDLSMSDMAGMKKRSGTSGLLIDALGTSSSSGKGRGSVTTQEEHQEDMQAKRLLWQQEVEFHESNVRRQRAAMVLENERVEEENAKMTSQRSPQQSARIAHTSSDSPASPNVTSDLRLKLRDLESEMEEMKARNILLENEKNDALRAAKREKEVRT